MSSSNVRNEDRENELVQLFIARASTEEHQARFHLEAAAWDLETALYNFLLTEGGTSENQNVRDSPLVLSDSSDPEFIPDDNLTKDKKTPQSSIKIQKKDKKKASSNSKFATLKYLEPDSSSDEEEGQAFYAGGSVRSGQQILGPGKNKNDIVADMFKSVKQHGGVVVDEESGASTSRSFVGTGYTLGATMDDSVAVQNKSSKKHQSDSESVVVLRLWRNGFSLDNGDLRPYDDPRNAEFLQYIRKGEMPPELRKGAEIFLNMEDRRHEDFVKISAPSKPFQGKGCLLGSPAPAIIGSTAVAAVGTEEQEANQKTAQESLNINENEPITTIQFRLADGSRICGRFNHTHTVDHLRQFIITSMPIYQLQSFVLMTTFPNKELNDSDQTLKEAGLLNALVVQKLK